MNVRWTLKQKNVEPIPELYKLDINQCDVLLAYRMQVIVQPTMTGLKPKNLINVVF